MFIIQYAELGTRDNCRNNLTQTCFQANKLSHVTRTLSLNVEKNERTFQ